MSSINPKVFMSRMVRAQPQTVTVCPPRASWSAKIAAMVVRSIVVFLSNRKRIV